MDKRERYEGLSALKDAQQRFEKWRRSQSGRRPIPEPLWMLAAELAGQHGVFRTAQALRLDYTKLKQHTSAAAAAEKPASTPAAAFVELMTPGGAPGCECVIEVEGPRGRMRIEWKGATAPDLAGLSRMLWEPGTSDSHPGCGRAHRISAESLASADAVSPGERRTTDNNLCERALKKSILNRKNALLL